MFSKPDNIALKVTEMLPISNILFCLLFFSCYDITWRANQNFGTESG